MACDQAELRSWAINDAASRGSSSNTVPELDGMEDVRARNVSEQVRKSWSQTKSELFHPDLDVKHLLAGVKRFYDRAPEWPFPVGMSSALRNGLYTQLGEKMTF